MFAYQEVDQATRVDAHAAPGIALEKVGGRIILMASRALGRVAKSADDYAKVYERVLKQVREPVIIHWLGDMFDPHLAGYWGTRELTKAMDTAVAIINASAAKIDGVKISLLDKDREIACARHRIAAISPWRDQIAAVGFERAARAIKDAGLKLSGYCRGGLFAASEKHRQEARDDNRRYVDEAAALGAPCLIIVAGGLPQYARPGSTPSKDIAGARALIEDGLAELVTYARTANLPLALEPLHPMYCADRAAVNTLGQALDIAARLDPQRSGALDVAVDVYHTWWDPNLYDAIARAGREKRILAYLVSNWLVPTRDLLNERGMMGDGVIELLRIRATVESAGYSGLTEAEIFFDYWWAQPIDTVLATCVQRYCTVV